MKRLDGRVKDGKLEIIGVVTADNNECSNETARGEFAAGRLASLPTEILYALRSRHAWNSGFTCSLFGTGRFTS